MADTIGTAYVQIEPSFDGVVPKIDKEMGGAGEKSGSSFGQGFAKVAGGVGKVALAAVGTAAAGITALTTQAVDALGDYEQLEGGAKLMFGESYDYIADKAANAFNKIQMSQNDYLKAANNYAYALKDSYGGNAQAAAELTDKILTAQADYVAATGKDLESVQNAFGGILKNNYSMLDNIGWAKATKEGMQELIDKVNDWNAAQGNATQYTMDSIADQEAALVDYISMMGMAGYAQEEGLETIQGALAATSAAWDNLIVAIASGDDLSGYIDNLVTTLGAAFENLMPAIEQSLQGIGDLIVKIAPIISDKLPALVDTLLPPLLEAATSIIDGLVSALPSVLQTLVSMLPGIIDTICQTLISNLPLLVDVALQAILTLANGITQSLPTLIPQIVDIVIKIVDTLLDNLDMLIDVAIDLIMALTEGLVKAQPKLIEKMPELIGKLVVAIVTNLPKIAQAGVELILTLIDSFVSMFGQIFTIGSKIVDEIKNGFSNKVDDAKTWGRDLIDNFINGIKEKWEHLKQTVGQVAESIKSYLGFSEPEEGPLSNFHTYAPDMMDLFSKGIKANSYKVTDALAGVGSDMMDTNVNVNHMVSSDFAGSSSESDVSAIGSVVASAIKDAIMGLGIYMDSKQVGQVIAPAVNNSLGVLSARRV